MSASRRVLAAGIGASMVELASGLVVPDHVAEEQRNAARVSVRWTMDKWKQYRRTFANLMRDHIILAPHCGDCNSAITVVDLDGAIPGRKRFLDGTGQPVKAGPPNTFALRCNCTDRVVVQGV